MSLPVYSTGTVSVAAGGTVVTGTGGMWSGINAKQGDFISINNLGAVLITEVTDATHLKIPPWPGAAQTNVPYAIYQNYVGRVVGVAAAEDVGVMLEKLHTDGLPFIVGTTETVPDPSYGDDGQFAYKPDTQQWWIKSGGVWVITSNPGGIGEAPNDGVLYGRRSLAWAPVPVPFTSAPEGRLTLVSGVAVPTSDVVGANTVYWTPLGGTLVPIWNGTSFDTFNYGSEITLLLDPDASHPFMHLGNTNYDLFLFNDAGTIRIGTMQWTNGDSVPGNNTTRGTGTFSTELDFSKGGIPTNKNVNYARWGNAAAGATLAVIQPNCGTYVGTIRTSADGQCTDSAKKRFVFNAYHPTPRLLRVAEAPGSWTYSAAAFRQANGNALNQVEVVSGFGTAPIELALAIGGFGSAASQTVYLGVGVDSTTVDSAVNAGAAAVAGVFTGYASRFYGNVPLGWRRYAWLEQGAGSGTQTWVAQRGAEGMVGSVSL